MNSKELRKHAIDIFNAALVAVNPYDAVKSHVEIADSKLRLAGVEYDLDGFDNVFVIGAGKAGAPMAKACEELLGERITGGVVTVKYGHSMPLEIIKLMEGAHPVPDEACIRATAETLDLLKTTGENDLVICLISGGGSALLISPAEGITLGDKRELTKQLLSCGATIHEINALRKHVSKVKGGRLARLAYPSTLITLVLSDVIGDDLDVISSGPTVPDRSTYSECLSIIDKYSLRNRLPHPIFAHFEKGARGEIEETPRIGDPIFEKTRTEIIASNRGAAEAAFARAKRLGFNPLILSTSVEGDTTEIAKFHSAIARDIINRDKPVSRPACVITGGETTVTVKGAGKGGRNQEFALVCAIEIDKVPNIVMFSAGTDGADGPTDAAGAIADGETITRAANIGLDARGFLQNNDSYNFFKPLDDLVITGPTHTNVMDIRLILVG